MPLTSVHPPRWPLAPIVVLAATGGWMDAVAYVRLHAFVANTSGSAVLLGLGLVQVRPGEIAGPAAAIAGFLCGSFAGSATTGAVRRVLTVECALLLIFALIWAFAPASVVRFVLLATGGAAMGVQQHATNAARWSASAARRTSSSPPGAAAPSRQTPSRG